ncbi:uncharacterized protein BJ212DRAFT_1446201 [Suillus subaureus]|uniref:Uncharacterized protein n=1 Tax=Suillus subaureus TaxID=48587 RepID=A0A9P7EDU1_9AGAM|nr:uncharacterized protein BJ212DRAFT_1446201 [Suillus subaureus]KAG1819057.1 hypothetical protein BJ212DRAFT_1446201 [Suillus subaureus]
MSHRRPTEYECTANCTAIRLAQYTVEMHCMWTLKDFAGLHASQTRPITDWAAANPNQSYMMTPTTYTSHLKAGYIFGVGRNMLDRLEDDTYAYRQKINHYYPFQDEDEWELGKFMVENLTQTQMIKFLRLKWCKYGDYMSTDMAWKIQDHLPVGLEMHLVFLTIGNIDSDICSKATLRAWRCIAYMPIAKFRVHPDYQSILQARLWHKCMDLVLASLKATALDGCFMPDPSRYIHYVFTPLIAHVCDLPEASMIVAVMKNTSPLTMAVQGDFGDGTLHPPRTGKHMLQCIVDISHKVDPWDLDKFQKAAKAVNLSRVHMLYWHDWIYTCVTHVKQMMGCEYREIQCTIFVHAIHAIVEFIYLAQNSVHSPETLRSMEQALSDFHVCKGAIIEAEARKGKKGVKEDFFIPKLELLQSFKGTVQRLGTLMQFSADTTECLLITHCKDLFSWMARQSKDFTEQCVQLLNCQEYMEIFDLYALLSFHGVSLVNAMHAEEEEVAITNPALAWVSRVLPDEVKSVCGPQPVHNHFLKGIFSGDVQTTFQVNITPDYKSLGEHTCWDPKYGHYQVWNKFWLQLHSAFQQCVIMPSRVVQAYPPSNDFPLSNCDTILIDTMGINCYKLG